MEPTGKKNRKWTRRTVATGATLAMVAATVVAALWIMSVDKTPPEAPPAEVKRIAVEVSPVEAESYTHHVVALGTVKPLKDAALAPQVAGPIVDIPQGVDLGAAVEEGEFLARIKPTNYSIALEEAEANLSQKRAALEEQRRDSEKRAVLFKIAEENVELVKAEADRFEALYKEGVISRSERDSARERFTRAQGDFERTRSEYQSADAALRRVAAEVAQAEARLARAREDLANTRITAPFSGVIAEKAAEVGDHVAVGQTIFRLVDISRVKVLVNIPTEDIHSVQPGTPAKVTVAPFPDRPFRAVVANVSFEGDVKNRTFPVELLVENPSDLPLRAGMFATARMAVRTYEGAILVERRLIHFNSSGPTLFVADPEARVARMRAITTGRLFGERYQVTRGLAPGDLLITEGVDLLSDGAPITLAEPSPAPSR